jgi:hypothetical protein
MIQTAAGQIADAKAEAYWSTVERRKATSRAYKARPICCRCKVRPVEAATGSVLCKTDADEYRRLFGEEP